MVFILSVDGFSGGMICDLPEDWLSPVVPHQGGEGLVYPGCLWADETLSKDRGRGSKRRERKLRHIFLT
jgi:hypothetical protein